MEQPTPIALVRGEPFSALPQDLYIPPEALEVFLETFQGPLDLLLYLIRRHNLDVLDIPMAELTRQYMAYVDLMRTHQLELAADYLLMAAVLIEIKSRMLLPKPKDAQVEETDPRAELVRRLLEYEQFKHAALVLDELPRLERDFFVASARAEQEKAPATPQVSAEQLLMAWAELFNRAQIFRHHVIAREQLSVKDYMQWLMKRLNSDEFIALTDLFEHPRELAKLIVTFLAVLELVREDALELTQRAAYAPIYVRLKNAELGYY